MDGRLVRKRYGRRIAFLATTLLVGILLMGGFLLYLSMETRQTWNDYSIHSEGRTTALSELHRAVGYGGFIHNFKNYVLRKDSELLSRLSQDIERIDTALLRYSKLPLSSVEKRSLAIISDVLGQYRANLTIAEKAIRVGLSSGEIDRQVRVNDEAALQAFRALQQEAYRYNYSISSEMNQRIAGLINALLLGLLSMPFVIMAAYHYHSVIGRFISLRQEKQEVEQALESKSAQVALAEENHLRMAYEAHHCELTQVANRKAFMKNGQRLLDEAVQEGRSLSVLFVDVDDFKAINDNYGHEVGDRVLVEVAKRLTVVLREGDFVARIGGDEFAVMIRCGESWPDAQRLAERLLEELNEDYNHIVDGLSVSCSVGGAYCPDEGIEIDQLIRVADERMYCVKKSGKNGVFLQEA